MDNKTQYNFESYFVDHANAILHVDYYRQDNDKWYSILIDTLDDPDLLYFAGGIPSYEDDFRVILYDYLKKEYPDHFY